MARHFTEIGIETYRAIKDLRIKDIGDVNVLVGDNNSGKTSVLEAIQILCDPSEYNILQVARQREMYIFSSRIGMTLADLFLYMFSVSSGMKYSNQFRIAMSSILYGKTLDVVIQGKINKQLVDIRDTAKYQSVVKEPHGMIKTQEEVNAFDGKIILNQGGEKSSISLAINKYSKTVKYSTKPILKARSVQLMDHITSDAFSNIIRNKRVKSEAISILREFDESISDLRYIQDNNMFVPVIESDLPEYLPLSMYGDGMKKVLTMLNAMVDAKNGVVLVDEFETAIHTSAMEKVFNFIIKAAKDLNVQLFLTTHSIEAIDKLLSCAGEDIDNIRVITLERDISSGRTLFRNLPGSEVLRDRKSFDFEVRQ